MSRITQPISVYSNTQANTSAGSQKINECRRNEAHYVFMPKHKQIKMLEFMQKAQATLQY
jgi:hypothetical protein